MKGHQGGLNKSEIVANDRNLAEYRYQLMLLPVT